MIKLAQSLTDKIRIGFVVLILAAVCTVGTTMAQEESEYIRDLRAKSEQGDADAQYHLGAAYDNGKGVPQNYREAYIWYSLAAANGDKEAAEYRDKSAKRLSPADLSSAQKEAARRHAEIQGGTDN